MRLLEEWRENLDKNYIVAVVVTGVLMDLLKAFDCIPNDLLVPKPSAYGFNGNTLKYIYTYNVSSDFKENILGIPQSSIVGSILFNALFLNDFFFCVRKASAHNFADDNAPS